MAIPKRILAYSVFIIALGIAVLFCALFHELESANISLILFYMIVSFFIESLSIDVGNNTYISLGFAICVACVFIFTPAIAGAIIFVGVFFHLALEDGRVVHLFNTSLLKRLFNSSSYAIIVFFAGCVYRFEHPYRLLFGQFLGLSILHMLLALAAYIVLCIGIYACLFSMLQQRSIYKAAKEYSWIISKFMAMAPIGIVIAIAQTHYGWFSIVLFMGPLLLARYSFIQYVQMKDHYLKTINSFTRALDAKDQYTNGHSERVSKYAVALAERMALTDKQIEELKTAALLHDIGKIGVPDTVLNKPGRLSLQEFYEIKRHPEIGARIIEEIPFLKHTAKLIRHHHERFDGTGYPDALRDDAIPIEAKIIAIADTYDAMTSDRPYRTALSKAQALNIISSESGRQFSPGMAKIFVDMLREGDDNAD